MLALKRDLLMPMKGVGRLLSKGMDQRISRYVSRRPRVYSVVKEYDPYIPSAKENDEASKIAAFEESKNADSNDIMSIDQVRRKTKSKKNLEKLINQLSVENEDPLIRRAYEELEDENRRRLGLGPLKRPPPGKLRAKDWGKKRSESNDIENIEYEVDNIYQVELTPKKKVITKKN